MSELWLPLSGAGPLHMQVYSSLRTAITTGRCKAGEKLPSSRGLASALGVSRTSTQTAYEQLVAEGYVQTRHGAGSIVAARVEQERPDPSRSQKRRKRRDAANLSNYATRALASIPDGFLSLPKRPPLRHDFLYGVPSPDLFPRTEWRRALSAAAKLAPFDLSQSSPQGLPRLRRAIARHLERSRGLSVGSDQILVTSGVQQGLQLVARVLCSPGDGALLEEPGYPFARATCLSEGLEVEFAPVDHEGMDIQAASRFARSNSRFAHVTPAHQFPMGSVLSFPRRIALLDWAAQNDAFVFEDDYDSEYRYEGRPVESLCALDTQGRVLYAGSFSKIFSTELRVGYLVLPTDLVAPCRAARWLAGWGNPLLEQVALALFIEEGHLERHIRRCRKRYGQRRLALMNALASEFGERATVVGDRTGLHVFVRFSDIPRQRSNELTVRAAENGIGIYPADDCFMSIPKTGGFVLGYGLLPTASIPRAVSVLAETVGSFSGR